MEGKIAEKGFGRQKSLGYRRSDAGIHGSREIFKQSKLGKNGLCHSQNGLVSRWRSYVDKRAYLHIATLRLEGSKCDDGRRDV